MGNYNIANIDMSDQQFDDIRELIAYTMTELLHERSHTIGMILSQAQDFKHFDLISTRVEEVMDNAEDESSADFRAIEFTAARKDSVADFAHDPVEMSRSLSRLAESAYVLNDVGTQRLTRACKTLWELNLETVGIDGDYPEDGKELVNELLDRTDEMLGKLTDPVSMAGEWNDYVESQRQDPDSDDYLKQLSAMLGINLNAEA